MLKAECYSTIAALFLVVIIAELPVNCYSNTSSTLQVCQKLSIVSLEEYFESICPDEGFQDIEVQSQNNQFVVTSCCYAEANLWSDVRECPLSLGNPLITTLRQLPMALGFDNFGCIRLNLNNLSTLPEDLFEELKNLKSLDFRWEQLKNSRQIFEPLTSLEFLDLKLNNLTILPSDFFGRLKNVTRLNLSFNNLTHLTGDSFKDVSLVSELDLSSNNLVSLNADTFLLLKDLSIIDLSWNNFDSLPEGLFIGNKFLSSFKLTQHKVQLKHLPDRFLAALSNLDQVHLSCGLTTISPDFFSKSGVIQNISLFENKLTVLPNLLFADQVDLAELDLSKNQLTSLPNDIFQNLTNLIVLRLSHNQLTEISDELFSQLESLEMLYIDNNKLMRISPVAFNSSILLGHVDLHNNFLRFDPFEHEENPSSELSMAYWFRDMSMLKLNLRNNSIQIMPRSWSSNDLDLSYNNISFVTLESLAGFGPGKYINLTHNSIRTIDFKIKLDYDWPVTYRFYVNEDQNKTLVDFGFNPLHCDCRMLDFVLFLQADNNGKSQKLKKFFEINNESSLRCSTPEKLKDRLVSKLLPTELLCPLDNSKEEVCPIGCTCWIRDFDKTLIVNCSNGAFLTVPPLGIFNQLEPRYSEGIELYMENNRLVTLPLAKTPGYEHIVALIVPHNNLSNITLDNLPENLKILNLSHNKLERLCGSVTKAIAERPISSVYLGGNPLQCDCQSQNLLQLVHTRSSFIIDREDVQCSGKGAKIQDLTLTSICPPKQRLVVLISAIVAVLGLFLGVTIALFYKYNQQIKIWLYAKNMCNWWPFEPEVDKDRKYDAFISYSHKDEDFIATHLAPGLENGPAPFKLCLHTRDWIAGHFIPDQIVRSVNDSRRTIIVLSPNFIESIWARMEFRAAHTAALNEGRARLIVVLYGDLVNIAELDSELQAYLKMNTYVK